MGTIGFPVIIHVPWDASKPDNYLNIWDKEIKELLYYVKENSIAYKTFLE